MATDPKPLVWGVAALLGAVASTLEARFASVTLRGEISGLVRAASGHVYLSLKDADGQAGVIRGAMFRRAASALRFEPADGQLVEVKGRVAVYEPRGELQLVIEAMQRAGSGALFEQFLKLRAQLQAQGLFDAHKKRPLPAFPHTVGIITSPSGAAVHDVLTTLARRAPHVRVVLYPSLVQGADAPAALVAALAQVAKRQEIQALIVCRGGGSLEDLWAFNTEQVVRAIAACAVPVVCGVGHETDVTLADLAADLRAATPTAGAELIAPAQQACLAVLAQHEHVLRQGVHQRLEAHAQRLDRAMLRLQRPQDLLRRASHQLALLARQMQTVSTQALKNQQRSLMSLEQRLGLAVKHMQAQAQQRLSHQQERLEALHPRQVLQRGYAWLADAQAQPVTSVTQLTVGQTIALVLADGQAQAEVKRAAID